MERKPPQFTIRAAAFATFWLGVCFTAFGLARSGILPSAFFPLAVISLCGAVYALSKDTAVTAMPGTATASLATIVVWNVAVWLAMLAHRHSIGPLVRVTYETSIGDIQASYGTFVRVAMFVAIVAITLPATVIGIWLFDKLSRRSLRWRQRVFSITVWEALVLLVLVSSYEIDFPYSLNQLGWAVFGAPENLYSFRNLVIHRVAAWLIETTPVAWTALWLHAKLS